LSKAYDAAMCDQKARGWFDQRRAADVALAAAVAGRRFRSRGCSIVSTTLSAQAQTPGNDSDLMSFPDSGTLAN